MASYGDRGLLRQRMRETLQQQQQKHQHRQQHPQGRRDSPLAESPLTTTEQMPTATPSADIWVAIVAWLGLAARVRLRSVCRILADGNAMSLGTPEGLKNMELGPGFRLALMTASRLGCALLTQVQELFLYFPDSQAYGPGELVLPPLPCLERFWVCHAGLCEFEAQDCPRLRDWRFHWEACAGSLVRFSLNAGPELTEFTMAEFPAQPFSFAPHAPGVAADSIPLDLSSFALHAPGLEGTLDLSEFSANEIKLHCPLRSLTIIWPSRAVKRRVRKLDVGMLLDGVATGGLMNALGGDRLVLTDFTGLKELSVTTGTRVLEIPEAPLLQSLRIEAPAVASLDLSEWTAFGELRVFQLRRCHALGTLRLPLSGELRKVTLDVGPVLRELQLHLRAAEELELSAPVLQRLCLSGCAGGSSRSVLLGALGGCPQLTTLDLVQCIDLLDLELWEEPALPNLVSLNLTKLSRAHRLRRLRLLGPCLAELRLPATPLGSQGAGIRHLELHCPQLQVLDLSSLLWRNIEILQLHVRSLETLQAPSSDALECLGIQDSPPEQATAQVVEVESERLLFLDLHGLCRTSSLSLRLTAPGVRVCWPRQHHGDATITLTLVLPHAVDGVPPPSPLDAAVCSVVMDSCGGPRVPTATLLAAVARWPRLQDLLVDGCTVKFDIDHVGRLLGKELPPQQSIGLQQDVLDAAAAFPHAELDAPPADGEAVPAAPAAQAAAIAAPAAAAKPTWVMTATALAMTISVAAMAVLLAYYWS